MELANRSLEIMGAACEEEPPSYLIRRNLSDYTVEDKIHYSYFSERIWDGLDRFEKNTYRDDRSYYSYDGYQILDVKFLSSDPQNCYYSVDVEIALTHDSKSGLFNKTKKIYDTYKVSTSIIFFFDMGLINRHFM